MFDIDLDLYKIIPWIILSVMAIVSWFLLLRVITQVFEKWVIKYLDWSCKPTPEDRPEYLIELDEGEELEKVTQPAKAATVGWYVLETILNQGKWLIVGGLLVVFLYYITWPSVQYLFLPDTELPVSLLQGIATAMYISSIIFTAVVYWGWSWWHKYRKIVKTTRRTWYIELKLVSLAIFVPFLRAIDPRISWEWTYQVQEVKFAPDIEDIGGEQTPWLRDQLTKLLSEKLGLMSMAFYSIRKGGLDFFPWVPHAFGELECFNSIFEKARGSETYRELFRQETAHRALEREDASLADWSTPYPKSGETFFLFDAQDPGKWDPITGKPVLASQEPTLPFDYAQRYQE